MPSARPLPTDSRRRLLSADSVVIGDPEFGATQRATRRGTVDGVTWKPLSGTRRKAVDVAARLSVGAHLGAEVTEEYVKQRLPAAPVIHLARHGVADMR